MVVITDQEHRAERIRAFIESLDARNPAYQFEHFRLGIVHQMYHDPANNVTERRNEILSTLHITGRFALASMAYAGKTRCTDQEIETFGIFRSPL